MKAAEWRRISEPVAEVLPGFRRIKFGFVRVDEWVAACVYADTSAFSRGAFYVEAFALPRFVPTEHLYFDYGFRLGDRWDIEEPGLADAVRDALPRLNELATLGGLQAASGDWRRNIYHAELRLCLGLLAKDERLYDEATRAVTSWALEIEWEADVIARCEHLVREVEKGGSARGMEVLEGRRAEVDRVLRG